MPPFSFFSFVYPTNCLPPSLGTCVPLPPVPFVGNFPSWIHVFLPYFFFFFFLFFLSLCIVPLLLPDAVPPVSRSSGRLVRFLSFFRLPGHPPPAPPPDHFPFFWTSPRSSSRDLCTSPAGAPSLIAHSPAFLVSVLDHLSSSILSGGSFESNVRFLILSGPLS